MVKIFIFKKIIKEVKEHEINEDIKEESLLPLATLLPIFLGALGASGGVAGEVAKVVQSAKTSQRTDAEKKLAEEQLPQLKKEKVQS